MIFKPLADGFYRLPYPWSVRGVVGGTPTGRQTSEPARATLPARSSARPPDKRRLNVRPANIRGYGSGKDQFEGALKLSLHGDMVVNSGIANQAIGFRNLNQEV